MLAVTCTSWLEYNVFMTANKHICVIQLFLVHAIFRILNYFVLAATFICCRHLKTDELPSSFWCGPKQRNSQIQFYCIALRLQSNDSIIQYLNLMITFKKSQALAVLTVIKQIIGKTKRDLKGETTHRLHLLTFKVQLCISCYALLIYFTYLHLGAYFYYFSVI